VGSRVLLTGATGFVGGHLYPALVEAGHEVVCASRDPERAARRLPERTWVALDLHRPELVRAALEGIDVVYYLVHSMAEGEGYREREERAARGLRDAAAEAGVRRVVYLGGVEPAGPPSEHLESRLATGRTLREGPVPCIELRAGMIIGAGSASWRICRDLAVRLPFMVLPRWLATRSQPVAIEDVVAALVAAATVPAAASAVYDIPGPEILTAKEILFRIARLHGTAPVSVSVPLLSPRLSSYWVRWVSGADFSIARELVEGLRSDLVARGEPFWTLLPDHRLVPFDEGGPTGPRRERRAVLEPAPPRVGGAGRRPFGALLRRRTRPSSRDAPSAGTPAAGRSLAVEVDGGGETDGPRPYPQR
jgi:uncharacterized protein YbjT (DUF2867 family)